MKKRNRHRKEKDRFLRGSLRFFVSSVINPCFFEKRPSSAVRGRSFSSNHFDEFPCDRHVESVLLRAA